MQVFVENNVKGAIFFNEKYKRFHILNYFFYYLKMPCILFESFANFFLLNSEDNPKSPICAESSHSRITEKPSQK